ncbi:MAG TPA: hypothetical protein VG125_33305 [Pirellulales bacterium]|jgi:hypothetical protein|nr:hypothetical protein [Pirellulales bacterium]
MQCERFESRLNEVLDARQPLSSATDLREHIRECAQCRELARAYESVLIGLEQAEVPPEPALLTRRILGQLRPEDGRGGHPHRPGEGTGPRVLHFPRRRALAMAAAAVVIAVVGLPWMFPRGANPAKDNLAADPTVGQHAPQVARTSRPPQDDEALAADSRPRRQQQRRDFPAVGRGPLALLDPSQLKADDLINSLPATGWAHDVADGLEPVTKPTVGAINGFLQLWGIGDEGHRS